MDEIVALANSFRHRHLNPSPKTLDDIPPLTHTLTKLHYDSTRLLPKNPTPVHPAALRLFSALNFDTYKLHSAITNLDFSVFLDRPLPPVAPLRHPLWLADRATDDARLANSSAVRHYFQLSLLADIQNANQRLIANVALLNDEFDLRTPARPSRSTHTPDSVTPRQIRLATTAFAPATHPRPSALCSSYVEPIRSIALNGDGLSTPTLMYETAASVPEPDHFVESLAVLESVSRHSAPHHSPPEHLIVWGARVVLEDLFADHIGGLPTKPRLASPAAILPRIHEYVRGVVPRGTDRVWPSVYFCLRIGNVEAALQILRDANSQHDGGFDIIITIIKAFLKGRDRIRRRHAAQSAAYGVGDDVRDTMVGDPEDDGYGPMISGCLEGTEIYQELETEYQEVAWDSNNPYMRVSFVLLMRLELQTAYGTASEPAEPKQDISRHPRSSKHEKFSLSLPETDISLLLGSVEDYLWFRLWLCRPSFELGLVSAPLSSSIVQLEAVQEDITCFGSHHFDPEGSQPLLFVFVLVSVGLYETAMSYLARHSDLTWSHYAVHLGMVLYNLKWLSSETTFHDILNEYISQFRSLHPVEAALYVMTLRDSDVVTAFLKELVLSTKEFENLLGCDTVHDSEGVLGTLLRSASVPLPSGFSSGHLKALRVEASTSAAKEAYSQGDFATAAKLYNMAGDIAKGVEMITHNLCTEVDKLSSQKRPLAVAEAKNALRHLQDSSLKICKYARASLPVLVKVSVVFEDYWTGRYGTAWDSMRSIEVLPLSSDRIFSCHRELSRDRGRYYPGIRSPVSELLKAALHIAEYALETNSVIQMSSSQSRLPGSISGGPRHPDSCEIKSLCVFASSAGLSEENLHERLSRIEQVLI